MADRRKSVERRAIPHRSHTQGIKYSKTEVLELKKLFDLHDLDKDGRVTPMEMYKSMASHKNLSDKGREAFKAIDLNSDGVLDFSEYLRTCFPYANANEMKIMQQWTSTKQEAPPPPSYALTAEQLNDLHSMFNIYDKDKSGRIERKELMAAALNCGYDDSETEALFTSLDKDGDEFISFDEFVALMGTSFIGELGK